LRIILAVTLGLVSGFAALSVYAWQQKRAAEQAKARTQTALDETRKTLSQSDFLQALRSIAEAKDYDALAQLARSLSFDRDNQAAACRLTTLLTYRDYATPLLRLKHDGKVVSAQFSPDGKRIVTASEDKTARIWDAQTGQPLSEPMKHDDWVWSAQFSPDGKRIVTASNDNTARIWDAQTAKPLTEPMKQDNSRSAQFSPDGKRIVTVSGVTARIWDAQTGQPLTEPMEHDNSVMSAQFSPDGKRIVTASNDNTARIWDAQTGKPLTGPMKHDSVVWSAQFSPDGKRIVTTSWDSTVRIWDAQAGKLLTEPMEPDRVVFDSSQFSPDRIPIGTALFSPDGIRIVTALSDSARIWDISPTGKAAPDWLLRLADAVAEQHLNDRGVFEPLSEDPIDVLKQIKDQLGHERADDDWAIWGRWFLADRSTRTISPFSTVTVPEYIENRIKENTSASLDEAEQFAVGNAQLLDRIQHVREALKQKGELPAQP
jgi:WD40 repeat protein